MKQDGGQPLTVEMKKCMLDSYNSYKELTLCADRGYTAGRSDNEQLIFHTQVHFLPQYFPSHFYSHLLESTYRHKSKLALRLFDPQTMIRGVALDCTGELHTHTLQHRPSSHRTIG